MLYFIFRTSFLRISRHNKIVLMRYVILFESSAAYRLHRNLTSPAPPGLHPLRAALSAHELWLCRRIIIPYLWSSQGRAAKLGVQTDRTRSRGICRGHGVSSDVLAKVRTSQTKSDSICLHYIYCRKYSISTTKNLLFSTLRLSFMQALFYLIPNSSSAPSATLYMNTHSKYLLLPDTLSYKQIQCDI